MSFAQVAVPPLPHLLTYRIPPGFEVNPGDRVTVPLGKSRWTSGFVISTSLTFAEEQEYELKEIATTTPPVRSFLLEQLPFFQWIAKYYAEPLSSVLDTAIPSSVKSKEVKYYSLSPKEYRPQGSLQKRILDLFDDQETPAVLEHSFIIERVKGAATALKTLVEKEVLQLHFEESTENYFAQTPAPEWAKTAVELNREQKNSLAHLIEAETQKKFAPFLLHGVTGSGKTEVYIEAIRLLREQERGALVLVPEIALTPQLIDRFRARFGESLVVLHSGLSKRIRWDGWKALLSGKYNLAIGARSAIFAPINRLGLIIVDEEHDHSFKQSEGLRYNARDLALARAKLESCSVILGSATPSLETYHNAISKKYHYLSLPTRHHEISSLTVEVVDLSKERPWTMKSQNISPKLHTSINEAVQKGEQTFLLYNRRGFSTYLQCLTCAAVILCPHCSVTLTFHRGRQLLLCHYCGYACPPPEKCPSCAIQPPSEPQKEGAPEHGALVYRGSGTEKIVDEVKELFPQASVERLDRDAVINEQSYRSILDRVRKGEINILIGTQMIAKGHDLGGVTLVGIINADVGIHLPDFRASEKTFQLLTQASGRAGRGTLPGKVIIQTTLPHHLSIQTTLRQDYRTFAARELDERQLLNYPPFYRIARVLASSEDPEAPFQSLQFLREVALLYREREGLELDLLGPAPAPLLRLKNKWRAHLLVKSRSVQSLHAVLGILKNAKVPFRKVKLIFDIDPYDLL